MGVGVGWHVGNQHPTSLLHIEAKGKTIAIELLVPTVGHILA